MARWLIWSLGVVSTLLLSVAPCYADALDEAEKILGQAIQLAQSGRVEEAGPLFVKAASIAPNDPQVNFNAGFAMMQMRRPVDALAYFEKSLAVQPSFREAHIKAASVLRDMGRQAEVVSHLTKAIALDPDATSAYLYLGDTLNNLKRFSEAIDTYTTAVEKIDYQLNKLKPHEHHKGQQLAKESSEAHLSLGDAHQNLKKTSKALWHYKKAARVNPHSGEVLSGLLFAQLDLSDWTNIDKILRRAVEASMEAVAHGQPSPMAPYKAMFLPLQTAAQFVPFSSSWAQRLALDSRVSAGLSPNDKMLAPTAPPLVDPLESALDKGEASGAIARLRIGYLSRRFERYPGTQLMLRLFSRHDRSKVLIHAYAFGPDDGSEERATVAKHADKFVDISSLDPKAACELIRRDQIHVLIDYDGMHDFNSAALLALRPAPTLVTWLGFAGPTGLGARTGWKTKGQTDAANVGARARGADSSGSQVMVGGGMAVVDFVLVDSVLVKPHEVGAGYSEAMAYMPAHGTYQPQDEFQGEVGAAAFGLPTSTAGEGAATTVRFPGVRSNVAAREMALMESEYEGFEPPPGILPLSSTIEVKRLKRQFFPGMPETSVVLACLSRNNKFEPEAFDDWMAILSRVPQVVLVVMAEQEDSRRMLKQEAAARGVNPSRIFFAPKVSRADYFLRMSVVDLFLDTRYYGAHTVAADALWVGVPVLTQHGASFAGRVGASLYNAADSYDRRESKPRLDAMWKATEKGQKAAKNEPPAPSSASGNGLLSDVLVAMNRHEFVETGVRLAGSAAAQHMAQATIEASWEDEYEDPPDEVYDAASGSLLGELKGRVGDMRGRNLYNSSAFSARLETTYSAMWEVKRAQADQSAADVPMPHLFTASRGYVM